MSLLGVEEYINRKLAGMDATCLSIAANLENKCRDKAPWKDQTGLARKSITSSLKSSGNSWRITTEYGVKYGGILEKGSPAHIIRPKAAKALFWSGAEHPVNIVHHPGTKPTNHLMNTVKASEGEIAQKIISYWSE